MLRLIYVEASSEDLPSADLCDIYSNGKIILYVTGRSFQLPAVPLDERPAEPTDTAESVGLYLEGVFFLMLPKELWILIAEKSNAYQRWQRNFSHGQLA
ncbi:Hsp70-like protein [Phytophthora palmivora]|uniref:Hsp70-like protein n=1 Tax=Phytophthora palmivora TaxID=4796 RepID=A0A2P4YN74_9STRA|nr:Hsp70-like protein [Phytophthora palmivora]